MSAGVRPRPVVLPQSLGVGAVGRCCVVALCCGPAVALGGALSALAWGGPGWCMGVGSRRDFPCVEWAWLVQWALVWPGHT
jgi:hypothetical protein